MNALNQKRASFVYYYHFEFPDLWERDMRELKDNDIEYLILLNGFGLRQTMSNKCESDRLHSFLNFIDRFRIKCFLSLGSPQGLYLDPKVEKDHLEYISTVTSHLSKFPALYGLYLEDEPGGGMEYRKDAWAPCVKTFEEGLKNSKLAPVGKSLARKNWKID